VPAGRHVPTPALSRVPAADRTGKIWQPMQDAYIAGDETVPGNALSAAPRPAGTAASARRARRRVLAAGLLAVWGPGLIVMLADTDAGCLITAAQSGAQWGYAMVLPQIVLIPILFMAEEIVVRLGVITGKGHGSLIREHFGLGWGLVSGGTLLICTALCLIVIGFGLYMVPATLGFWIDDREMRAGCTRPWAVRDRLTRAPVIQVVPDAGAHREQPLHDPHQRQVSRPRGPCVHAGLKIHSGSDDYVRSRRP
jgi:hypothetical protein